MVDSFGAGGFDLGTAHGKIVIDGSGIADGVRSAQGQLNSALNSVGQSFQNVGKTWTTHLTAPLVGAGIIAGKMAIDFESAFAGVRKTVNATEEEFAILEDRIKTMATSPDSLTSSLANADVELAKIMELAGQLGVSGVDNLSKFTETIALLSVTTNIVGEEGALALAQFANITQMPIDQIDQLGSVIVDLGNNMATTEADILSMASRIAGAGNIAGLTQQDIFALGAALSSAGIRAEAGGTAISRVLLDINTAVGNGDDKLQLFAETAGMTAEQFASLWQADAASALDAFIDGLGRIDESGGNVAATLDTLELGEIRVRDALLRLATGNDLLTQSLGIADEAWQSNTALQDEAAKRAETTESGLNRLWNNVRAVAESIGEAMLPALDAFVEDMIPVLQNIATWIEKNPELVDQFLRIAAVIAIVGPALFILGGVISTVSTIVTGLSTAFGLVKTAVTGLLAFAFTPLGVALIAGGLLVAAYLGNWMGFKDWVDNELRPGLDKLWRILTDINNLIDTITQASLPGMGSSSFAAGGQRAMNNVAAIVDPQDAARSRATLDHLGFVNPLNRSVEMFTHGAGNVFNAGPGMLGGASMGGGSIQVQIDNINASSYEEGQAAADGFTRRLGELRRARD